MEFKKRKRIRLREWDYATTAWYFVTICCHERRKLFGEVVDADGVPVISLPEPGSLAEGQVSVKLSPIGLVCDEVLRDMISAASPDAAASPGAAASNVGACIVDYVIMPNHVHLIVALSQSESEPASLPNVIRFLKSKVTKRARELSPGVTVWQGRFYDHVIRDDADLERIQEYMVNNPAQWADDRYFIW